ncbi:MAG TPA: F0F1 ATP synthase subunit A [Dehalococcoidia bacterium]|nr:F0F1 ATP synthase subunit A [Dehalococcoidia bacterium]
MKNPRTWLIVIGALALLLVGFVFFRSPKPIIEIKAETLTKIGPFPLVNTYVTSLTVVVVLIVVAYLATRKIGLVPSGLQNLVESVMEAMYNICINTAGEKNGRRFFPVVMTIFTFIWIANWMALLPFFNAIGSVEKVTADEFKPQAVVFSKSAGISLISPNQKSLEFDKAAIAGACASYATPPAGADAAAFAAQHTSCLAGQRGLAIATKLDAKEGTASGVASCTGTPGDEAYDLCLVHASDKAIEELHAGGKQLGVLVPYFRSMNTDINSPLSIAIMAMIFIEFWGITTLGVLKYGAKFLNFSSPINFFVGILEFIAELARIISFTFRLFGNMLAGEILLLVMTFLVPFLVALPFYGLETFVGVIQAFVFAMLTLVFGVLAVSSHGDHEDDAHDEPHGQPLPAAAH